MEAIILAGGRGTRLGKLTDDIPKPMLPINGRLFLEYLMDYWIAKGVTRFILALGYKYETVINHFDGHYKGAKITYSIEHKPLGPAPAITLAMQWLGPTGTFVVCNGDTLLLKDDNYIDIGTIEDYKRAQRILK